MKDPLLEAALRIQETAISKTKFVECDDALALADAYVHEHGDDRGRSSMRFFVPQEYDVTAAKELTAMSIVASLLDQLQPMQRARVINWASLREMENPA